MEYGILVVEDGNGLYQIIGSVFSPREAAEMARDYMDRADPEEETTACPPNEFVIWRNKFGGYTQRETLELLPGGGWNLLDTGGSQIAVMR